MRPPRVPPHLTHVAVDCGSYVLAQRQVIPGYHFTAEQYVNWISALGPAVRWAVLPDWPCEGAGAQEVRRRQVATTDTAIDVLTEHLGATWCWCPVLRGRDVEDFLRHAIDIAEWVYELRDVYAERGKGDDFRVCIGSLCRRNAAAEIRAIVSKRCCGHARTGTTSIWREARRSSTIRTLSLRRSSVWTARHGRADSAAVSTD